MSIRIKLAEGNQRSPVMVLEQRWMYKVVRYDEGRTGMVVDIAMDGSKLAIRREYSRPRANESVIVWRQPHEVELLDVKPREK